MSRYNSELFILQEEVEMDMAIKCYNRCRKARKNNEEIVCDCEDPFKWTKEQCEEYISNNIEETI